MSVVSERPVLSAVEGSRIDANADQFTARRTSLNSSMSKSPELMS